MRVADFIAKRLHFLGCRHVYMVTGGAAMHLNDAFAKTFAVNVHNLHHEQSCAMAAESYARITGKPAVVNVTAGPGAINAINGVFGAFVDSIPMIVVSGQAKRETLMSTYNIPGLRQLGDQEVDIVSMVKGVCKEVKLIDNPLEILEIIDSYFYIAVTGRQGPVWLDIPIDVQAYQLPESLAQACTTSNLRRQTDYQNQLLRPIGQDIDILANRILTSNRPVLYVGNGVRLSDSYDEFLAFIEEWPLATVTGWNSNDLLWDEHPCYCGRPGTVGNRAGNFAIQYSECLLTVGCRLNLRLVSFNWKSFAKNAWSCHVDIDKAELDKPTLNTNLKIHASIKGFFPMLSDALRKSLESLGDRTRMNALSHWETWRHYNKDNLIKYHSCYNALPPKNAYVNPYRLVDTLSKYLDNEAIIVCADGTACVVGFQALVVKIGQRLYHNSGCASMGYDLPAAIGAYHASQRPVVCIAGDGSIMMNLQELAYIGGLRLPIIILLMNNKGYHSIRQTQNNYFPDNPVGCGIESGLPFPDFSSLAHGFGLAYLQLSNEEIIDAKIQEAIECEGPVLLEVILDLEQEFAPKLASKKLDDGSMVTAELEDMSPLLGDETINAIKDKAFAIKLA
jgi:acetolactate synthase-1/2/3 large subunit